MRIISNGNCILRTSVEFNDAYPSTINSTHSFWFIGFYMLLHTQSTIHWFRYTLRFISFYIKTLRTLIKSFASYPRIRSCKQSGKKILKTGPAQSAGLSGPSSSNVYRYHDILTAATRSNLFVTQLQRSKQLEEYWCGDSSVLALKLRCLGV